MSSVTPTPSKNPVKLSVNLNKVALLRNARGEARPNIRTAGLTVLEAGADGLTLHPRPDRRHATLEDVLILSELVQEKQAELNIEGNPLAPPQRGYPGLIEIVRQAKPAQVTLVPDGEHQRTSDHGWQVQAMLDDLKPIMTALKDLRDLRDRKALTEQTTSHQPFRISLFMDVDSLEFPLVKELGADRIELYTKDYADHYMTAQAEATLEQYILASQRAVDAGLTVNAGHDLNLQNLRTLAGQLAGLEEVSIGHALIDDALYTGLDATVRAYKKELAF